MRYDPEFPPSWFSPCHYAQQIPSDVAVLSVSGWMDGAGYQNGAIARFLTLPNRNKHLLLGPGITVRGSTCRPGLGAETPEISPDGELLRFVDAYLMELETRLWQESPVHYFTMHEGAWRETAQWPPAQTTPRLLLGQTCTLSASPGGPVDDRLAAFPLRNRDTHALRPARRARYPRLLRRLAVEREQADLLPPSLSTLLSNSSDTQY